jgi:hypothetical protein
MPVQKKQIQEAYYRAQNGVLKLKDLRVFVEETKDLDGEAAITAHKVELEDREYGTNSAQFFEISARHVNSFDKKKEFQPNI